MNGIPCTIHGLPALYLGIVNDDDGRLQAVYTTEPPCMYLSMTHPSQVRLDVPVVAAPAPTPAPRPAIPADGMFPGKIALIKLLREAVAKEGDWSSEKAEFYLSLSRAKQLIDQWQAQTAAIPQQNPF